MCIRASHGTICVDASCQSRRKSPHQKVVLNFAQLCKKVVSFSSYTMHICARREPTRKTFQWKADTVLLHGCELLQSKGPPCVLHFRVFLYIFFFSSCVHTVHKESRCTGVRSFCRERERPPWVLHGSEQTQCWQCKRAIDAPGVRIPASERNQYWDVFINIWRIGPIVTLISFKMSCTMSLKECLWSKFQRM